MMKLSTTLIPAKDILAKYHAKGWREAFHLWDCYLLFSDDDQVLLIPCEQNNPSLVDIRKILNYTPIRRSELETITWGALSENHDMAELSFDLILSGGKADEDDLKGLLGAIGDLNRTAGGNGFYFSWKESDASSHCWSMELHSLARTEKERLGDYRTLGVLSRILTDESDHDKGTVIAGPVGKNEAQDIIAAQGQAELMRLHLLHITQEREEDIYATIDAFTKAIEQFKNCLQQWYHKKGMLYGDLAGLSEQFREGYELYHEDTILTHYVRKGILKPVLGPGVSQKNHCLEMIRSISTLPSPKGVAMEIIRLVEADDTTIDDLQKVLRSDPGITARLLRLANSPMAGQKSRVTSIDRAVLMFGFETVKNLSIGFSLIEQNGKGHCDGLNYTVYWLSALTRAVAAQQFTKTLRLSVKTPDGQQRVVIPTEMFTTGLLSKIGQLALAWVFPKEYQGVLEESDSLRIDKWLKREEETFHMNHNELSAMMMADWYLPDIYCKATAYQDKPWTADEGDTIQLAEVLNLGNQIATALNRPKELTHDDLRRIEQQAEQMGLSAGSFSEQFSSIIQEVNDICTLFDTNPLHVPSWEVLRMLAG